MNKTLYLFFLILAIFGNESLKNLKKSEYLKSLIIKQNFETEAEEDQYSNEKCGFIRSLIEKMKTLELYDLSMEKEQGTNFIKIFKATKLLIHDSKGKRDLKREGNIIILRLFIIDHFKEELKQTLKTKKLYELVCLYRNQEINSKNEQSGALLNKIPFYKKVPKAEAINGIFNSPSFLKIFGQSLGKFYYYDKNYCITLSEISLMFFILFENWIIRRKWKIFITNFIENIHDGREMIKQVIEDVMDRDFRKKNLKNEAAVEDYEDEIITLYDPHDAQKEFIIYFISMLINTPDEVLRNIYKNIIENGEDNIENFVNFIEYTIINFFEFKENNEEDLIRQVRIIGLKRIGVYTTLFIIEGLKNHLLGMITGNGILATMIDHLTTTPLLNELDSRMNKYLDSNQLEYVKEIRSGFFDLKKGKTKNLHLAKEDLLKANESSQMCQICRIKFLNKVTLTTQDDKTVEKLKII